MGARESRAHPLIGKKFHRLRVICDDGTRSKGGEILWLCLCECGDLTHALGWQLKSGKKKSCGCLDRELKQSRFKDLTGFENENVKVIRYVGSKRSRANWECLCKHCGNAFEAVGNDIGKHRSCGCLRTGASKEYMDSIRKPESRKSSKPTKRSTTGVRGVYLNKKRRSYQVFINVDKKSVYLGSYKDFDKAVTVRKDAEKKYGYKDPD